MFLTEVCFGYPFICQHQSISDVNNNNQGHCRFRDFGQRYLLGTPANLHVYFPQIARAYLFPQSVKKHITFTAAPISVDDPILSATEDQRLHALVLLRRRLPLLV